MRALLPLCFVLFAACSLFHPPQVSLQSLAGSEWVATDIGGRGVDDRVQSTLRFDDGGRISGRAACNRYSGSISERDGVLETGQLATTRMACPPLLMDQETRFIMAIAKTQRIEQRGEQLVLLDADGAVLATLARM